MNASRIKWIIFSSILLSLGILIFRPVPKASLDNTFIKVDTVESVFEGSSYDLVFKLSNHRGYPYINRGIQMGMNVDSLKQKLTGKKIKFRFVDHWTPLDFDKSNPTVAFIQIEETGEIIYNNIKF